MVKRIIVFCAFAVLFAVTVWGQSQNLNVDLAGRWAKGRCEAISRRGEFTFIGNGHYIEVYRNRRGIYTKMDDLLLPGPVKDIWVKGDLSTVYAACGEAGFRVIRFDPATSTLVGTIGLYDTPGYASGVMVYGNLAYLADGNSGLLILDVEDPFVPKFKGSFSMDGFARRVWVVNSATALVAADFAGLYSVKIDNPAQPEYQDSIKVSSAFPGFNIPDPRVYSAISLDTIAYVAAGWGGMRMVNIKDPYRLTVIGKWTYGLPVEVRGLWVSGNYAYLACGNDGFFSPINISNPANPTGPTFLPVKTSGYTTAVVTDKDTAFVGDGYNGHVLVNIQTGSQPFVTDSTATADDAYDALISGNQAYVATGKTGVKVFDLNSLQLERMEELYTFPTKGEARGLKKINSRLYVADGSHGLTILSVADPLQPTFYGEYVTDVDTCFDVDVAGSYALMACGKVGVRVVDISQSIFEIPGSPFKMRGKTKAIQILKNKAYIADSTAVYVYDISKLPSAITLVDSLPSTGIAMQAVGLDVTTTGDSVFVANGSGGFLLWNRVTKTVKQVQTTGRANDLVVREKTLFVAGGGGGLRIFDFSVPGSFNEVGFYNTEGRTLKVTIAPAGGRVCAADGDGGLVVLQSNIYPKIAISPALLNFGPVPPNYSRSLVLWVLNQGTTLLKVTDIKCNKTSFKFSKTAFNVAPGDTFSLVVRFEPNVFTPFNEVASAAITSNDPAVLPNTTNFTLQGEVTALVTEGPYTEDQMTVGLYHFDEANGVTSVTDASGNGFHGVTRGDPRREDATRSLYGRQIFFDKQNDWISIPFNPAFNFYSSPFTAELWFNMATKPQNAYLLLRRGIGNTRQFELAIYSDTRGLQGSVWDANGVQYPLSAGSLDLLRTNQWYHTAMTFDGDTLKVYLNGVMKNKVPLRKRLRFESTEPITIGATTIPDAQFHGVMDEVRISNMAREPWEFHVNRSRLDLDAARIDFGKVLTGYSRRLPLKITNSGSQSLVVTALSTTNTHVTVNPSAGFALQPGQGKTVTATFVPVGEEVLGQGSQLTIESSDPTYPTYSLPLAGSGITAIPAGAYKTDAFSVGLWHFDESAGTTAYDSSGYGMHGTLFNGAFFDSQKKKFDTGRSVHFDGQNDLCRMAPVQGQFIGPRWGGMTVEGWFTLESIPLGRQMFLRRGKDAAQQFEVYIDSTSAIIGKVYNTQGQVFTVSSKSMGNVQPRIWYHTAMVLNADTLSMYINGNKTDSKFTAGQIVGSAAGTSADSLSLLVGRDWEGRKPLLGNVDEVRISSIARQPWEFNVNLARIVVSDSLLFGDVPVGKERMRKLWVKNTGIDRLIVDETTQTSPVIFKLDSTRFTVNPGDSVLAKVVFKPSASGKQTARITFRTNDPFWPTKLVNFAGTGIASVKSGPYATDPFTVVLYHMNEKPDTVKTIADSSGNRLNGTLEGSTVRSDTGRYDRSVQFTSGRVRVPSNVKLNLKRSEFTADFWFQMQEKPKTRILLFKLGNGDTSQVELSLGSTDAIGFAARVWNAQGVADTLNAGSLNTLNVYQWYHAALSWDGDSLRLYLNALLKRKKAFRGSLLNVVLPAVSIGADEKRTAPFKGRIDEFRLSRIVRKDWEFGVVPPSIAVSPTELNFANVLVNQSRVLNFWVINGGDQDLKITTITGASAPFVIPDSVKAFSLSRMKNKMIPVTYTPTLINQNDNLVLSIVSNDPIRPAVQVRLSGSGAEMKAPEEYKPDAHTLALYHFNQVRLDTVPDASGKNHYGIMKNGVRLVSEGYFGGGLSFDGFSGRVEADTTLVFNYQTQSFTIECYFKTDTVSQSLLFKGFSDTLRAVDYGLMLDGDGRLSVNGFPVGGPRFSDGSWHHVAFAYNHFTKTGKLYGDGNQLWSKPFTVSGRVKKHDRPLVFGAAESKLRTFFRFFKGTLDEIRISDIAREPWEFQWIDFGIRISSVRPDPPETEKPVTIQFTIPIALQATGAVFQYRPGGGTSYVAVNAEKVNATTYKVTLPGTAVTLEGLEYYIKVLSAQKTFTYPLIDPVNHPLTKTVKHFGLVVPLTLRNKQFQMISVPFKLDTTDIPHVLVDDLGSYDPHLWRLFWWHREDTTYVSFTDTTQYIKQSPNNLFDFFPGRAYWITTYLDRTFDIGRGQTVTTDSGFVLPIPPGWTMLGDPFNFTVKWDDCSLSSDSLSTLYYYRPEDGYHVDYPQLDPWKGYWIYNADTLGANLVVLPRKMPEKTASKKTSANGRTLLSSFSNGEWMLRLSAEAEKRRDSENYAGVRTLAKEGWDAWDRPEPPPVENDLLLSFDNSGWTRHSGPYAADIRPAGTQGHVWDLYVETRFEEKSVMLYWNLISSLPEGWQAYLFDPEEGNSIDVLKEKSKTFKSAKTVPNVRPFRLVVGTPEFIKNQSEGISLEPAEFHLYQNYPNPFNPQTTIYYTLEKNGETEMVIFNTLGQKVRTLLKQPQKAGRYETVWDGRDERGQAVPSGVYLLKLQVPDRVAVRKMTVLK